MSEGRFERIGTSVRIKTLNIVKAGNMGSFSAYRVNAVEPQSL